MQAVQIQRLALPSMARLFGEHARAMEVAQARLMSLFPAFSDIQRAALAEGMPALMNSLLSAQDALILGVCLEAEAWIGPLFSDQERSALSSVATSGWELEAYENAFLLSAARLSHFVDIGEDSDA